MLLEWPARSCPASRRSLRPPTPAYACPVPLRPACPGPPLRRRRPSSAAMSHLPGFDSRLQLTFSSHPRALPSRPADDPPPSRPLSTSPPPWTECSPPSRHVHPVPRRHGDGFRVPLIKSRRGGEASRSFDWSMSLLASNYSFDLIFTRSAVHLYLLEIKEKRYTENFL